MTTLKKASTLEKASTLVAIIAGLLAIAGAMIGFFPRSIEANLENSVWKVCFHCTDSADFNFFVLGENRDLIAFDQHLVVDVDSIESVSNAEKDGERGIYLNDGESNLFLPTCGNWHMKGDTLILRVFEGERIAASISADVDDGDTKRIVGEGSETTGDDKFPVEMNRIF